jgi:hypothetical protein
MKRLTTLLLLCFANYALCDMPADAPGKLRKAEYWNRCNPGLSTIPSARCQAVTNSAKNEEGCINAEEHSYAISHGVIVHCVGEDIVSACPCSCFDSSTNILSTDENGNYTWLNVTEFKAGKSVVTLSEESTVSDLTLKNNTTSYKTQGLDAKPLLVLESEDGNILKVTGDHGVLLADGRMIAAKDLKVDDSFISFPGQPVKVQKITRAPASGGEVHNILVDTKLKQEHLVIANGIVVGDLLWQNSLGSELNSVLLRQ